MPANFPSSVPIRYPLGRAVQVPSRVIEFLDGSEQRWRSGPVLNGFQITLGNIPRSEADDVQTWFAAIKGAYDTTWSLTVMGETFPLMALNQDELDIVENEPTRYVLQLKMRQTAPSGSWPSVPAFPGINGGRMVQRPWTGRDRFRTTRNDLPGGARFSAYEWGTPRREWELQYPCITPTELTSLMQHFVTVGGQTETFSFTDPDSGTAYANTRYATDEFSATYVDAGHCRVALPMVAILA